MKYVFFACLTFLAPLSFASASNQATSSESSSPQNASLQNISVQNLSPQSITQKSIPPILKPKIVGGELAADGDWPSVAALVYNDRGIQTSLDVAGKNLAQTVHCAASFIGNKWVVTAAHCVVNNDVDTFKVNIGAYDLTNIDTNATKSIKRIYIHPDYSPGNSYDNDIALIELAETQVHPVMTLMSEDETRSLALANSLATVIGWGSTIAYGPGDLTPVSSQENTLLQVELSLLSNEQCKDKLVDAYEDFYNTRYSPEQVGISDSMICAHYPSGGKGSCQGDSGGPLMVNTSQGWQQIGIVSHGIGCGEEAFPDVYTRVSKFTNWINGITQGITFEPSYDFAITPQYQSQTQSIAITNHSDLTANLTFSLIADSLDNSGFSVFSDNCATLSAKEICFILVTFDAQKIGHEMAKIVIETNDIAISTSDITITAQAVATNSSIENKLTSDASDFLWFSGGDQPWQLANSDNAIHSGELTNGQESSVLLTFSGEGSLSFEWALSSEESTLESGDTFGTLYLIIDGEQIDFISGEVAYTAVSIENLTAGEHQVLWLYQKGDLITEGEIESEDRAYLKNVVFSLKDQVNNGEIKSNDNKANSSGGSIYSPLLLLTLILIRRLYGSDERKYI